MQQRRLYLVSKNIDEKDFIVGLFSNRKILFQNLNEIGLDDCFIEGIKKRKSVTPETIATGFKGRGLTIFKSIDDLNYKIEYKVLQIRINQVNTFFRKRFFDKKEI